jgi:hypothetical protein
MSAENPYLRKEEHKKWDDMEGIDPYSAAAEPLLPPGLEPVDTSPLSQQRPTSLYKSVRHPGDQH